MARWNVGEVAKCEHCRESNKRMCQTKGYTSCEMCLEAAGVDRKAHEKVICSVCKGVGAVWVGPATVTIHQHDHAHTESHQHDATHQHSASHQHEHKHRDGPAVTSADAAPDG